MRKVFFKIKKIIMKNTFKFVYFFGKIYFKILTFLR